MSFPLNKPDYSLIIILIKQVIDWFIRWAITDARMVVHDPLLAEAIGELLRRDARRHVRAAASGDGDDYADGFGGVVLRGGDAAHCDAYNYKRATGGVKKTGEADHEIL